MGLFVFLCVCVVFFFPSFPYLLNLTSFLYLDSQVFFSVFLFSPCPTRWGQERAVAVWVLNYLQGFTHHRPITKIKEKREKQRWKYSYCRNSHTQRDDSDIQIYRYTDVIFLHKWHILQIIININWVYLLRIKFKKKVPFWHLKLFFSFHWILVVSCNFSVPLGIGLTLHSFLSCAFKQLRQLWNLAKAFCGIFHFYFPLFFKSHSWKELHCSVNCRLGHDSCLC